MRNEVEGGMKRRKQQEVEKEKLGRGRNEERRNQQ